MKEITIADFSDKFKLKRNPIKQVSPFENQMLDFDEDELDYLEERDNEKIWSVREGGGNGLILTPGLHYGGGAIGFFICDKKWNKDQEEFLIK